MIRWSLLAEFFSLFILGIIFVRYYCYERQVAFTPKRKLFLYCLLSSAASILLNILCVYTLSRPDVVPLWLNTLLNDLYFLLSAAMCSLFAYFLLVRAYGPVPVQPEQDNADKNQPRQSVDSVYQYIIQNLQDAAAMMYKNTDDAYSTGHVSAGSAAGLLAKVYATMASAAMPAGTPVTVRTGKAYDNNGDQRAYAPLVSQTFNKEAVAGYEDMDAQALYAEAARWAEAVIVDKEYGDYELLPYDNLWKKQYATSPEFMFSIGSVSGNETYAMQVHTQYDGYRETQGSDFIASGGWIGCTRHWYDLFDHDDYRITQGVKHRWRYYSQEESNSGFYYPRTDEYSIMATGYDLNGEYVGEPSGIYADGVSYNYSYDSQCLAFTTKYSDVTNNATENADANWPFLRYADVMLVYAEALNELDDAASNYGLDYLNEVRQRSNAVEGSLTGNNALDTKDKRRSAIIEERAKEFACEADRRWDLIRWGILNEALRLFGSNSAVNRDGRGAYPAYQNFQTGKHELFPIPLVDIQSNPLLEGKNNPGY